MRHHLESAWKQTGRKPKQLEELEFPDFVGEIWGWFNDLHGGRKYTNEGHPMPLDFETIYAWSRLMDAAPSTEDLRVIKQLDNLFISTK